MDRLITELAVFDFTAGGMVLVEMAHGITIQEVKAKTEAAFIVALH